MNDYIPTTIQESRVEQSLIEKFSRKASEIIGEDNVSSGQADLLSTCRDFWPVNNIWMLEGSMPALPQLVVWPRSTNEASALLKLANELKVAVIPYGEGSGTMGGVVPIYGGVIFDLKNKALPRFDGHIEWLI